MSFHLEQCMRLADEPLSLKPLCYRFRRFPSNHFFLYPEIGKIEIILSLQF